MFFRHHCLHSIHTTFLDQHFQDMLNLKRSLEAMEDIRQFGPHLWQPQTFRAIIMHNAAKAFRLAYMLSNSIPNTTIKEHSSIKQSMSTKKFSATLVINLNHQKNREANFKKNTTDTHVQAPKSQHEKEISSRNSLKHNYLWPK